MIFPNGTTEHPINKSGKKKLLVSVWDFKPVHPQSERSYYLCNDHPAKMRPCLARAILQIYGESPVLDPMAGIGTTLIEAMLLGMDAVGVEFEKKFVDQANKNIEHVRKLFPNKNLGNAICIKGDARDLSCLNNQRVNSVIFSPPYFNSMRSQVSSEKEAMKKYLNSIKQAKRVGGKPISKALARSNLGYGTSKDNIGNITKFGSILFSPPYFDALSINKGGGSKSSILYEESTQELQMKRSGLFAVKKNLPAPYSSKNGNIGNISEFGSIIFNTPLREANRSYRIAKKDYEEKFGKDENLKDICFGRTYLGEMFKVYSECYRVLKPNKFMVVVVKDIRRKGLTIPLGADTIKLCQLVGFEVFDIVVNKMYFPSFWQLTHAQKTQAKGIPMTLRTHEYVLVFKKPSR
ncbi:MAG: DNA methyltransferase [Candidatus Bathyarchaeia archaeon]